jgi:hypothetical protein
MLDLFEYGFRSLTWVDADPELRWALGSAGLGPGAADRSIRSPAPAEKGWSSGIFAA